MTELKQCYDCEEYASEVDWIDIIMTEDDGFQMLLCTKCYDKREQTI